MPVTVTPLLSYSPGLSIKNGVPEKELVLL
jgi:hypothetical protein